MRSSIMSAASSHQRVEGPSRSAAIWRQRKRYEMASSGHGRQSILPRKSGPGGVVGIAAVRQQQVGRLRARPGTAGRTAMASSAGERPDKALSRPGRWPCSWCSAICRQRFPVVFTDLVTERPVRAHFSNLVAAANGGASRSRCVGTLGRAVQAAAAGVKPPCTECRRPGNWMAVTMSDRGCRLLTGFGERPAMITWRSLSPDGDTLQGDPRRPGRARGQDEAHAWIPMRFLTGRGRRRPDGWRSVAGVGGQ